MNEFISHLHQQKEYSDNLNELLDRLQKETPDIFVEDAICIKHLDYYCDTCNECNEESSNAIFMYLIRGGKNKGGN